MTEELLTFENQESFEQRLTRLLKAKGIDDQETKELLNNWTSEQEKQVEHSDDYQAEQIQFNLRRARLYFEAGYIEEAFANFEAAREQAWNERRDELYQSIMKEMGEIEDFLEEKK